MILQRSSTEGEDADFMFIVINKWMGSIAENVLKMTLNIRLNLSLFAGPQCFPRRGEWRKFSRKVKCRPDRGYLGIKA